jgi:hypothetical protein
VVPLPDGRSLRFERGDRLASLRASQRVVGGGPVTIEVGEVRLRLPAGAYPEGSAVSMQELPGPPPGPGLAAAGPTLRLEPAWRVPAAPGALRWEFDERAHRAARVGLYRWDALKESWIYAGGVGEARRGALEIGIGELGTFRLLEDVAPPEPGGDDLPAPGQTMPPSGWSVRIGAHDPGSGISWDGVRVELDGQALEAEYDPDRRWATAELPGRLGPGEHTLRVEARDRAGNASPERAWGFRVRR